MVTVGGVPYDKIREKFETILDETYTYIKSKKFTTKRGATRYISKMAGYSNEIGVMFRYSEQYFLSSKKLDDLFRGMPFTDIRPAKDTFVDSVIVTIEGLLSDVDEGIKKYPTRNKGFLTSKYSNANAKIEKAVTKFYREMDITDAWESYKETVAKSHKDKESVKLNNLIDHLKSFDNNEIMELWNRYTHAIGRSYEQWLPMDRFEATARTRNLLYSTLVKSVKNGDFDFDNEYFGFDNGYPVYSFNIDDDLSKYVDYERIAKYILEKNDYLSFDSIKKLLKK